MAQLGFLLRQLFSAVPQPTTSFAGKTVIVTGANSGLGLEAARYFTNLEAATVILAVRSIQKGEAARKDIESSTGRKDVLQVWHLDMSSYKSVLKFAARVQKDLERVDITLLNAGIGPMKWEVFEQDESTLTVNVISQFLLALALLPELKATAHKFQTRPNLTIVASEMHTVAKFPEQDTPVGQEIFEKLNVKRQNMEERYNVSKLLVVLLIRAIADQKPATEIPVTINCVCPGFCHSDITRDVTGTLYVVMAVMKTIFARSTEKGSRTLVHAVSQGSESHGKYFSNCHIASPSAFVLSPKGRVIQKRVWDEVSQKLEAIKPGLLSNL